jgi:ATP synthase protein I
MNNNKLPSQQNKKSDIPAIIAAKAKRKLHAKHGADGSIWLGLGMMGLIGWSIIIPTLLGAAIGVWLDAHYLTQFSWALALLMAGLTLGCSNAWHWVAKEDRAMRDEQEPICEKQSTAQEKPEHSSRKTRAQPNKARE